MKLYRPMIGCAIKLDCVTERQQELIDYILKVYERCSVEDIAAGRFASECIEESWRLYLEVRDHVTAQIGIPGKIYRDCFYRLVIKRANIADRPNILRKLRYHPVRLLMDHYLAHWSNYTQYEFAELAGIKNDKLSKAFKSLLHGTEDESGLTVEDYANAYEKLGIAAGFEVNKYELGNDPDAFPLERSFAPEYIRDKCLRDILVSVLLLVQSGKHEEAMKLLGLHIAAVHGISDVLVLNRYVGILIRELMGASELIREDWWPDPEMKVLKSVHTAVPWRMLAVATITTEKWVGSWHFNQTLKSLKEK